MTKNMDLEVFSMQMEINMREHGEMVRDGNMESINILMVMVIKVSGGMISRKVMENSRWLQEINIKEIGREEKRMEKVIFYLFRIVYFCKWRYL